MHVFTEDNNDIKSSSNYIRLGLFCKVNRDYGGTEDFFVDIAVELVLERRSLLDRKVLLSKNV